MAADRRRALRKVLSLLGVLPLGAYLAFHLWETGAAPQGRDAFARSVSGVGAGTVAIVVASVLVLVPLAVHAALGIYLTAVDRPVEAGGYPSGGARSLERVTGIGLALFLVLHVVHTWIAELGSRTGAGAYEALRDDAGKPLYLLAYVIGITCAAFHVGLGIGALPETWGVARTDAGRRALRGVGAVVGLVVWLVALNTLSHFAVGRALIGAPSPQEAAP